MSESERVQRWRQRQRAAGKESLTIWLTTAEKLRLEDQALSMRCSPSDLVSRMLAQWHGEPPSVTATVTDTEQLRAVTDAVADTIRQELPLLVRLAVEDLQLQSALPVTDAVTNTILQGVTDTVTAMRTSPLSHGGNIDVTATVTDTQSTVTFTVTDTEEAMEADVTATGTDTLPVFSADYTKETAPEFVTDTVTATVTGTTTSPPAKRKAPSRQRPVTDPVSDTVTITDPTLEPFDTAKYVLGKLCPRGHAWGSTGQSLLRRTNRHCCACDREKFQERGKVQRQARKQAKRQATGPRSS